MHAQGWAGTGRAACSSSLGFLSQPELVSPDWSLLPACGWQFLTTARIQVINYVAEYILQKVLRVCTIVPSILLCTRTRKKYPFSPHDVSTVFWTLWTYL